MEIKSVDIRCDFSPLKTLKESITKHVYNNKRKRSFMRKSFKVERCRVFGRKKSAAQHKYMKKKELKLKHSAHFYTTQCNERGEV